MGFNINNKAALESVDTQKNTGLSHNKKIADQKAEDLKKAVRGFEAIFIQHLLKTMRKSISKSGLFGEGISGDFYSSMFNEKIAEAIANKGGIGLTDNIIKSLGSESQSMISNNPVNHGHVNFIHIPHKEQKSDFKWDHSIIDEAANYHNLEPKLIKAIIKVESNFNKNAISNKGAVGLMQLMNNTAQQLGVKNRFDPRENIFAGVKYLKSLLQKYNGNLKWALGAYNAGPSAVEKYNGVPPFPETQQYVEKVMAAFKEI